MNEQNKMVCQRCQWECKPAKPACPQCGEEDNLLVTAAGDEHEQRRKAFKVLKGGKNG